jgi:hypothetical protein
VSDAERRRHRRFAFSAPVEIEWGSETLRASVADLSLGGMFVQTSDPLWLHARFAARIQAEEGILVNCIVRRVVPGMGMGVEFEALAEPARARVEKLLETSNGK